ncbi:MAG: AgmX/PglI C-terminal domain-containing protein [Myxococcales bacterium]|jgi:hypothetical protein
MATAQKQNQPKILRIGVIQGGKIIEERLVKKRETVTIGQASKNTIVIPVSNLPPSFPVFELKGGAYQLRFTDAMAGRLSVGDAQLDFAALKTQGLAKKDKDGYAVPLNDQSKGKIALGEVTLLFQFVTPPPEAPKPVLPPIAKGSLWHTIDKVFAGVLAATLCINFGTVKAITMREAKPQEELTLEELPDRFVKMIVPDKPLEPPKPVEQVAEGDGKPKGDEKGDDKPKGTPSKGPAGPVDKAARTAAITQGVQKKGLLKLLGAIGDGGEGGGALEDVLGSGSGGGDIASALDGAGGVGIATSDALAAGGGRKGGGSGEAADIGDLATTGGAGGAGQLTEKKIAKVSGRIIDQGFEIESSSCDRNAISRYIKGRIRALQACYERELKRNPSLKGKLVVRFLIGENGRVSEIEFEEDTLGNSTVAACIRSNIRLWVFPIKDSECPVSYPIVFMPSGS